MHDAFIDANGFLGVEIRPLLVVKLPEHLSMCVIHKFPQIDSEAQRKVCDLTATVTVQTVLLTTSTICKMPVLVLMWDPFQNFNLSLSPLFSYAKKFMFLKRLTLKTAKISCFSRLR